MEIRVSLAVARYSGLGVAQAARYRRVDWEDGLPLPNRGDRICLGGELFEVELRQFMLGENGGVTQIILLVVELDGGTA